MSTQSPILPVPKIRTYATDLTARRAILGTVPTIKKATTPIPPVTIKEIPPVVKKDPEIHVPVKKTSPILTTAPSSKSDAGVIPPFHTFQKPLVTTPKINSGEKMFASIDTSELTKKQATIKPSVLAIPTKEVLSVNRNDRPENFATIITDTKRSRFSFSGEIIAAIKRRLKTYQKNVAASKQPKYTLPETERRKGVIQKATSQTGRTSTADHAAVLDRIKNTKRTLTSENTNPNQDGYTSIKPTKILDVPVTAPAAEIINHDTPRNVHLMARSTRTSPGPTPVFVKPTNKSEPNVSSIVNSPITTFITPTPVTLEVIVDTLPTRTVVPELLERSRILPALPTYEPPVAYEQQPSVALASLSEIPKQQEIPNQMVSVNLTPEIVEPIVNQLVTITPEKLITPTPTVRPRILPILPSQAEITVDTAASVVPESMEATIRPVANWAVPRAETLPTKLQRLFTLDTANESRLRRLLRSTNYVALVGVSIVFIGMIVLFGMRILITRVTATLTTESTTSNTERNAFSDTVLYNATISPLSKKTLIDTVAEKSAGTDSLVEVVFTDPETKERVTAAEVLHLLNTTLSSDFKAALATISVGGYRGEPWIVLTTNNAETARGGMLQWEKTLGIDLSPWFGTPIKQNSNTKMTAFTDDVIGTHDVRVLSDEQKTERITYGFVRPNVIIITSNTTAFLNLAEKTQK